MISSIEEVLPPSVILPEQIDYVLLTDYTRAGFLPLLTEYTRFSGTIFASAPTVEFAKLRFLACCQRDDSPFVPAAQFFHQTPTRPLNPNENVQSAKLSHSSARPNPIVQSDYSNSRPNEPNSICGLPLPNQPTAPFWTASDVQASFSRVHIVPPLHPVHVPPFCITAAGAGGRVGATCWILDMDGASILETEEMKKALNNELSVFFPNEEEREPVHVDLSPLAPTSSLRIFLLSSCSSSGPGRNDLIRPMENNGERNNTIIVCLRNIVQRDAFAEALKDATEKICMSFILFLNFHVHVRVFSLK